MLDVVLRDPGGTLPSALLRDRMALEAAVACLRLENRRETTSDIRDAVCLARPMRLGRAGDALGPAGDMFMAWRKLARINLTASGWQQRLADIFPDPVRETARVSKPLCGAPVTQAAQILEVVLRQFPRQEAAALMLADVTLARALGWSGTMPLLAAYLTRKDIRGIADGEFEPTQCVHRAMVTGCDRVIRDAADLSRRASRLRAVSPKLRAKGAARSAGPVPEP